MKKLLVLLFIMFTASLSVKAVITPDDVTSEDYLINHGYSAEMVRLIDLQHAQINGHKPKYKRNEPDWYTTNIKVKYLRNLFMYFDPGLDDEKFMQHEIKYTTRWDSL